VPRDNSRLTTPGAFTARRASARASDSGHCFASPDARPDDGFAPALANRKRNLLADHGSAARITLADAREP